MAYSQSVRVRIYDSEADQYYNYYNVAKVNEHLRAVGAGSGGFVFGVLEEISCHTDGPVHDRHEAGGLIAGATLILSKHTKCNQSVCNIRINKGVEHTVGVCL
jgi:hypothetical protein